MNDALRIFLKPKEEREVVQGFPWVFDNEISHVKYFASDGSGRKDAPLSECEGADGSACEVFTAAGGFIGTGIINRKSKICVRMLSSAHADKVFENTKSFIDARIRDAANMRRIRYGELDSYRLVFAERHSAAGAQRCEF